MRAYVIREKTDNEGMTVGVTSSRKTAIQACEDTFAKTGTDGDVVWEQKDKHVGRVTKNGRVLTYRMFFVNRIDK
jgi:hypothetical protein